jgi:tRNA pseudouridine55 synthase
MAEGVLLVLVGEENKKREEYLGLDKEYEVEVLLGVESDTYDVLGKIVSVSSLPPPPLDSRGGVRALLDGGVKTFHQPYPPYSSKPVQGKPLFQWAREGKLHEITIPSIEVSIYSCDLLEEYSISYEGLLKNVTDSIKQMSGDFRQEEIINSWTHNLPQNEFRIIKIKVACSSGTYMRSLANTIGKKLGSGALALSIKRTKIGQYSIEKSLKL